MTKTTDKPKAQVTPLTEDEKIALQVLRFQNHVAHTASLVQVINGLVAEEAQLVDALRQKRAEIAQTRLSALGFIAEAKEQAGILLQLGFTQEKINGLVEVPSVFEEVDLGEVIP